MSRSAYALAALTTAAIPGFRPIAVRPATTPMPGCDAAEVVDPKGTIWAVKAPRSPDGAQRLERELAIWDALTDTEFGKLGVTIPHVEGHIDLDEGTRCIVHKCPEATPVVVHDLTPTSAVLTDVTRALAALHDAPTSTVNHLDIPRFSAQEYRQRRLSEVRSAVATGSVPGNLAIRWEDALADGPTWDFEPTITHGDLVCDHVLVDGDTLVTIASWAEIKIADPADDLAWLLAGTADPVAKAALHTYQQARPGTDDNFLFRSRLAGELSIARWFLHGMAHHDRDIISSARRMMRELSRDITA